jgi:hypothetical protein
MVNKLSVAGPDSKYRQPDAKPAGFWAGWWHGSIAPITLIVGLFKPGVRMYETHNTGAGYDVGFLLGLASVLGNKGAAQVADRKKTKQGAPEKEG